MRITHFKSTCGFKVQTRGSGGAAVEADLATEPPASGRDCSGSLPQLLLCDTRLLGATKGSYPTAFGGTSKCCGNFSGKPGCRPDKIVCW